MMKWFNVPREEQETLINIDYQEKIISFYTSRYAVGKKLERQLGKPHKMDYLNGEIASIEYIFKLTDKRVNKLLSKTTLIGGLSISKSARDISLLK